MPHYKIKGQEKTVEQAREIHNASTHHFMLKYVSYGKEIDERSDCIWGVPINKVTKIYRENILVAAHYHNVTIINSMDMVQVCHPDWNKSETMQEWCNEFINPCKRLYTTKTEQIEGYPFEVAKQLFPKAKGYVKGGAR